jgi:hypothetical protein
MRAAQAQETATEQCRVPELKVVPACYSIAASLLCWLQHHSLTENVRTAHTKILLRGLYVNRPHTCTQTALLRHAVTARLF